MEKTNPAPAARYVGLDIAKDRLDYTVDAIRCDHVPNTPAGHARLLEILRPLGPVRVVCEATGGYERAIVAALLLAHLEVCVVNPGRVRAFAHAEGLLAKTDRLDAQQLRRFGERVQPRLHAPMDAAAVTLRELLDYRRQVSDQLVALRNRLELAGPVLRVRLQGQVEFLEKELRASDRLIAEHIDHDDTLRRKATRLRELQGAGPVLTATLLAYVPELGEIESPQLSALVGGGALRAGKRTQPPCPACARRPRRRAPRPLHGGRLRHPPQPRARRLLRPARRRGQTQARRPRRRHAQNAAHPQSAPRRS